MIQNVAQFKKALQIGVMLKAVHHQAFAGRDEDGKVIYKEESLGVRPVSIVQTNSFALATEKVKDGVKSLVDSWCDYPKAKESKIENGVLTIYVKDTRKFPGGVLREGNPDYDNLPLIPILSYTIV